MCFKALDKYPIPHIENEKELRFKEDLGEIKLDMVNAGKIGLGDPNPSYKLHVVGEDLYVQLEKPVEFVQVDFLLEEKKCTCGAEMCNSSYHYDWCDLYISPHSSTR